jgi:hypothetical protein
MHKNPEGVSFGRDAQMQQIDLNKLEDELYRHGLAGFRRIREARPNERFYCFAFYTNGEYNYVALTASTAEGLDQVAQSYKQDPSYQAMTIDDLRVRLKWSPCDSPLHGAAENDLTELDPLIQSVQTELDQRFALSDDGKSYDEFVAQLRTCFANALKRMDADGVFGRGDERKSVVANLLMGDQSDEDRISFAELVNPPEAVRMLKEDLAAASQLENY